MPGAGEIGAPTCAKTTGTKVAPGSTPHLPNGSDSVKALSGKRKGPFYGGGEDRDFRRPLLVIPPARKKGNERSDSELAKPLRTYN